MSIVTTERERASTSVAGGTTDRGSGRAMRITSAPWSASIIPQNGPGPIPANSMILIPVSGPAMIASRAVFDAAVSTCRRGGASAGNFPLSYIKPYRLLSSWQQETGYGC